MIMRLIAMLGAAPLLLSAAPAPAPLVDVRVAVTGLRSERGVVRACLTSDSRHFPRCEGEGSYALVVPASAAGSLEFIGVRPGTYAIAVLHDENDNGKVDRVLGMMPKEGFGFSRDAKVRMGPPKFGEAAFAVESAPLRQTIRMRYML